MNLAKPHYLGSVFAATISLGGAEKSLAENVVWETYENVSHALSCPVETDFTPYTLPYTVQKGDTISSIAHQNNVSEELIRKMISWNDMRIGEDNTQLNELSIGQTILIPKEGFLSRVTTIGNNRAELSELGEKMFVFQNEGITALQSLPPQRVFPRSPATPSFTTLADSFKSAQMYNPEYSHARVIDSAFEQDVACSGMVRAILRTSDFQNHPHLGKFLAKQGIDAWETSAEMRTVGYFSPFNLNRYFSLEKMDENSLFPFINGDYQNPDTNYIGEIKKLSDYLKYHGDSGSMTGILQMIFRYSRAKDSVAQYNSLRPEDDRHMNTHVALFLGNSETHFQANEYKKIGNRGTLEEWESMSAADYVINFIRYRSDRNQYGRYKDVRRYLQEFADTVEMSINGETIDLTNEFISSSQKVFPEDKIQFSGPLFADGYHRKNHANTSDAMDSRTRFVWEFFASGDYYPTEFTQINIDQKNNVRGLEKIRNSFPILGQFSLGAGETLRSKIESTLLKNKYGVNYRFLLEKEDTQEFQVWSDTIYQIQLIGNQLWGNIDIQEIVRPGAFKQNAWIPDFVGMHSIDSLTFKDLQKLLQASYTVSKEYKDLARSQSVVNQCSAVLKPGFIEYVISPGETSATLYNTITERIQSEYSEEYKKFAHLYQGFDLLQRRKVIQNILGEEYSRGVLQAGTPIYIDVSKFLEVMKQVGSREPQSPITLYNENNKISYDHYLIGLYPGNKILQDALRFIMANESYENIARSDSEWVSGIEKLVSRRRLKEIQLGLYNKGYAPGMRNIIPWVHEHSFGFFQGKTLERLDSSLSSFSRVNSFSDFQLRFPNLLGKNAFNIWPKQEQLQGAIDLVLSRDSVYYRSIQDIKNRYPEIIKGDLETVKELQDALNDIDNPSAGKIAHKKLEELFRFDNGTHSNIIGKIIAMHLTAVSLEEKVQNIIGQFEATGEDITKILDSDSRVNSLYATSLIAYNAGERRQLLALGDNYITRFIESISANIPGGEEQMLYPRIRTTDNVRNHLIYGSSTFRGHMDIYISNLRKLENLDTSNEEQKQLIHSLKQQLIAIQSATTGESLTKEVYKLLSNTEIKVYLKSQNIEDTMLPSQEELNNPNMQLRRKLFRYANPKYLQDRRAEVELNSGEKTSIMIYATLLAYSLERFLITPVMTPLVRAGKILGRRLKKWKKKKKSTEAKESKSTA